MIQDTAPGYEFFTRKVCDVVGLDLSQYRPEQMERRLRSFLDRFAGETFFTLARRIEHDAAFAVRVRDFLTINVSEFFRNPERFRRLETEILAELCQAAAGLRVWSAGCSIGAEPYSLAISLLATGRAHGSSILATDVDPEALRRAREGVYRAPELQCVGEERLSRYFEPVPDGYRVGADVRRLVRFESHDLLRGEFHGRWDLIACRNVVIYFTEQARTELYRRFAAVLRPGGMLFVGGTESIRGAEALGLEVVAPLFYRKTAS